MKIENRHKCGVTGSSHYRNIEGCGEQHFCRLLFFAITSPSDDNYNSPRLIITEIYFTLSRLSRTNSQEKSTHAGGTISVIVIMRPLG